ncbi:replication factor-A protein 1, putative [Cryptosporidium muris RN66]|uniref:Replication factor-A protein 1, putative n=1 Tax=Cryptosporidium muris (strain RN66) TaxID=441375 RepID=B6AF35_CRYMR|nr:replication factor-A protein 1, putative [Cryptosporidium muris RN66]EEA06802.1 replication factor-A protein 1, putative [Cryptosporidium muris RN66]|eukprot:XP_002141151.1 replication factor-A protein 1 [Cryptosporidium muris RN66]
MSSLNIEYPSELQRGVCDQLLSGIPSSNGSIVVILAINLIRSGPRALVHVADAGSNIHESGVPLSIRLVMSDATQFQPGDLIRIIRFSLNEIHSTKLVTVIQFEKVGHWSGYTAIGKAIPHPGMGSNKVSSSNNSVNDQQQNQQMSGNNFYNSTGSSNGNLSERQFNTVVTNNNRLGSVNQQYNTTGTNLIGNNSTNQFNSSSIGNDQMGHSELSNSGNNNFNQINNGTFSNNIDTQSDKQNITHDLIMGNQYNGNNNIAGSEVMSNSSYNNGINQKVNNIYNNLNGGSNQQGVSGPMNSNLYGPNIQLNSDRINHNIYNGNNQPSAGPIHSNPYGRSVQQIPGSGAVNMGHIQRSGPYSSGSRGGPISRNQDIPVYPIKSITSYLHRWRIIGRVISKSDVRTFSSSKSKEGKVFSFEICDAEGSQIRATCFTKAVDKFYEFLKEGEIYSFSKGDVKEANAKFNKTGHGFEIIFNEDADIQSMPEDSRIPKKAYNFVSIADIRNYSKGQSIDILGILWKASPIMTITIKSTGADTQKRELTILDRSGYSIDLTLWSERTNLDEGMLAQNPMIAVKNAIIEEFNGFKLKFGPNTSIEWNPINIEQADELRQWFQESNNQNSIVSLSANSTGNINSVTNSQRQSIEEIIATATSGVNSSDILDGGIWVFTNATIRTIRDNKYFWSSCRQCKRKVTEIEDPNSVSALILPFSSENGNKVNTGPNYHCPNCQQTIEDPLKKYILSCELIDSTGTLRAVAFAEHGESIMDGLNVDQLESMRNNPEKSTEDIFADKNFSEWVFKLNGRKEVYQDSTILKYRIFGVEDMTSPDVLNREAKKKLEYVYSKLNGFIQSPNLNISSDKVKIGTGFETIQF